MFVLLFSHQVAFRAIVIFYDNCKAIPFAVLLYIIRSFTFQPFFLLFFPPSGQGSALSFHPKPASLFLHYPRLLDLLPDSLDLELGCSEIYCKVQRMNYCLGTGKSNLVIKILKLFKLISLIITACWKLESMCGDLFQPPC